MPELPDVAALVADPAAVATVPADAVPALLAGLAVERERLAGVERALLARLLAERPGAPVLAGEPDRLLTVGEAAMLVRRSESWMRHHGRQLPGFHQAVPGGAVRWSEGALRRWIGRLAS